LRPNKPSLQFHLVVGFTASNLESSLALLSDIAELPAACTPRSLVVCCDKVETDRIKPGLSSLTTAGVKVLLVPTKEIADAALDGQFGDYYSDSKRQEGIAFRRTVLHHYLYREAIGLQDPVVWILDDDVRLEKSFFVAEPATGESRFSTILARLAAERADIAIGRVLAWTIASWSSRS